MRPLLLILASADPARWRAAIAIAAAHAAHGAATRLHLDTGSVPALADPMLAGDLADARAIGVAITACPTGLADHAIDPARFADFETLGLVALMALLTDDMRLAVI